MTIRTTPLLVLMGLLVPLLEGALTLRNAVVTSVLALAVGVPYLFLVGICVQMLPRSWCEK